MSDDRDLAFAELERAGVIERTEVIDGNNNRAYRLVGFPPGSEGARLRALFDQHIQRGGLDGRGPHS
jgi:hypothetical protein